MKIRLLDFQAARYPEWASALEGYRKDYPETFDYRDKDSEDLADWLAEADRIFYHYGERNLVEPLLTEEDLSAPRRKYVVFSGGEALGAKLRLEKTGCPVLFGIGRKGLAALLPQVLAHTVK